MDHLRVHVENALQIFDGQVQANVIEELAEGVVGQRSRRTCCSVTIMRGDIRGVHLLQRFTCRVASAEQ